MEAKLSPFDLHEDTEFPPSRMCQQNSCRWKRPHEISTTPELVSDKYPNMLLNRGSDDKNSHITDAMFILASSKNSFDQVVHDSETFEHNYTGEFSFNFWKWGEWTTVSVDDRLPVALDGHPAFIQNEKNLHEYWPALLHKAYLKFTDRNPPKKLIDVVIDLSGGIPESFDLRNEEKLPDYLWDIILKSHEMESLMMCQITADDDDEEEMWNGLVRGHVYIVTAVIESRIEGWTTKLLRLKNTRSRNGWTGKWSEWISFNDFVRCLHLLDLIHLSTPTQKSAAWYEERCRGQWVSGVNAGGSESHQKGLYHSNPQFCLVLRRPDIGDLCGECSCLLALQVKSKRRRVPMAGFDVYLMKRAAEASPLTADNHCEKAISKKHFMASCAQVREVTCRLQLDPGYYYVIPHTSRPSEEAEFLLRAMTMSKSELGPVCQEEPTSYQRTLSTVDFGVFLNGSSHLKFKNFNQIERPIGSLPHDLFISYAGEDHVIDARDMRDLLSDLFRREFCETKSFGVECCRSLITLQLGINDELEDAELGYEATVALWDRLLHWNQIFAKFDRDRSGCIETYNLRDVFLEIGFKLHFNVLAYYAIHFGGKLRSLTFEDVVTCLSKTLNAYAAYKNADLTKPSLTLDKWLLLTTKM
ncbi:hypothetical protein CAPTEDRAFT_224123 [Capitella teleta]|uniref:Calpain catalytic domain-containing protein n=1 Tax=Capitella teleta TaxID=283909 RepID=R7VK39_CAPTE|nr:hypothetical protein CAPTEDRAFT_224123 [Capitella teleta]|eukprot:ELU17011.1 hypothetical protein CAPTEDRAFT_224123 [Capitella teleta]